MIDRRPTGPRRRILVSRHALPAGLMAVVASLLLASPAAASPAWLPPTELSAPGHDASEPVVAVDGAGETVAVWQRQSESEIGRTVQASTRSPGAAFSAPLQLSAAADEPTVAMTPPEKRLPSGATSKSKVKKASTRFRLPTAPREGASRLRLTSRLSPAPRSRRTSTSRSTPRGTPPWSGLSRNRNPARRSWPRSAQPAADSPHRKRSHRRPPPGSP